MPTKMKTRRTLALEKIPMLDKAPHTILNVDNTTQLYANFVAPGN